MKRIVLIVLCIFALAIPCRAAEDNAEYDLSENVSSEVEELLPNGYPQGGFKSEDISIGLFWRMLLSALTSAAPEATRSLMMLLGLILISSVLGAVRSSVSSGSVGTAMELLSSMCICTAVFKITSGIFETAEAFISSVGAFMSAALPSLVVLCAAGGRGTFAASSSALVSTALAALDTVLSRSLLPILKLCFFVSASSDVCSGVDLSGISLLLKKLIGYILAICGIGLSLVMMFQSVITKSADSAVIRGLKFTVGATVPIVGGAINEAMTTICGSVGVLRSTLGISGAVVICAMMIVPIVSLLINKLMMDISSGAAGMLMLKKEQAVLSQMSGIVGFLIAICAFTGTFFIITVAVMASAEVI